ncbi:hypothetical protein, partial [Acidithiobacillus thiooxidans]|uniref:hypothetical protein n=1 Tax=Acidithiobacillus thiooxidans TaxID=930 RepID=UPI000A505AF6
FIPSASHPLREAVLQILLNDHGINRQPPTQITKDVTAGLGYPHTQAMAELRLDMTSHTKDTHGLSGNLSVRQLFGGGASQTEAIATLKYRW